MSAARTTREPKLDERSPLAPIVDQLTTMARMLREVPPADPSPEMAEYVRGKVEGLESAITLLRRAGAITSTASNGQPLVQIARPHDHDPSLAERVAKLEKQFAQLGAQLGAIVREPAPRARRDALPAILETPAKRPESGELGRCEHTLLGVLAQRNGQRTTRQQLAILSGYSVTSSSFANGVSALRSADLAEGRGDDLHVTSKGLAKAGEVPPAPRGRALVESWCSKLGKAEATILRLLCTIPAGLDREELARSSGYSLTSSSFANAVSTLRSLQLAERGWPLRAADIFTKGAHA